MKLFRLTRGAFRDYVWMSYVLSAGFPFALVEVNS